MLESLCTHQHQVGKVGNMVTSGELALNEEQVRKFLSVIDNIQHLALFKLELCTGIRREDITNINLRDVDLEKMEIVFWESKKHKNHTVSVDDCIYELKLYHGTIPRNQEKLFNFTGRTAYNIFQKYLRKGQLVSLESTTYT